MATIMMEPIINSKLCILIFDFGSLLRATMKNSKQQIDGEGRWKAVRLCTQQKTAVSILATRHSMSRESAT